MQQIFIKIIKALMGYDIQIQKIPALLESMSLNNDPAFFYFDLLLSYPRFTAVWWQTEMLFLLRDEYF